jgi:hypothetical protein
VHCAPPISHIAPAPPAPIIARTGCGTFVVQPDGAVSPHRSNWAPAWAPDAISRPGPGVWVAHPGGKLAVYRAGHLMWKSFLRHGNDAVAVDGNTIAFQVWSTHVRKSVWIAHVGGREHFIAYGEDPLGWTANGLVTQHGSEIVLRNANGWLIRVVARTDTGSYYDAADRTVVFVDTKGNVIRTDGLHVWRLARGFPARSWIQLLDDRVIDVTTGSRSFLLRSDGRRLGITVPSSAAITMLPHDDAIVYVVRRGFGAKSPGVNVVYLARPRARPRVIYRRRIPEFSCGEATTVSYANGHVLYVDTEGPTVVLDPSGRTRAADLTRALLALQPKRTSTEMLSADWATKWTD